MRTVKMPYLVRLKPEFPELYKCRLEVGRDYQALYFSYHPDYMSIMGTTVDRDDKRHFDIEGASD